MILDKTSSQREDLLVCLVLCLVVAVFLERTKRIGTDSDWLVLRTYMTSHNWLTLTSHLMVGEMKVGVVFSKQLKHCLRIY